MSVVNEPIGNAAAMRAALCDIVMLTMKVGYSIHGDVACGIIASKAKHALSAPPRNCDVGTPEERLHRYYELCREISERHERIGEHAPSFAFPTAFEWEDRPYEEGGTNEQG